MYKIIKTTLLLAALLVAGGCAHSIKITPDADQLPLAQSNQRVEKVVGYFISEEERGRKVITPGGGGDKVEYAPYKELESGIYRVLNNVFKDVHVLKSADDQAYVKEKGISIVFRPTIATNSSSSSLLTWPPTDFEVIIEIKARDATGKEVWADVVTGKGKAEFSEFKSDFALSAKRASESALKALQVKLLASNLAKP